MLVDAETRHEVHNALEGLIGPKLAGALMSMLPTVDWDQVATKPHLEALEERMALRMESLEHRLGEQIERTVREAVTTQTRWFVGSVAMLTLAMIGSNYALVSALR